MKLFYFIYFTVSFVSRREKYEIMTETRPFKNTQPALPSKKLVCTKILIYHFIEPLSDEKSNNTQYKTKTISVLWFRLFLHVKLEKQ